MNVGSIGTVVFVDGETTRYRIDQNMNQIPGTWNHIALTYRGKLILLSTLILQVIHSTFDPLPCPRFRLNPLWLVGF